MLRARRAVGGLGADGDDVDGGRRLATGGCDVRQDVVAECGRVVVVGEGADDGDDFLCREGAGGGGAADEAEDAEVGRRSCGRSRRRRSSRRRDGRTGAEEGLADGGAEVAVRADDEDVDGGGSHFLLFGWFWVWDGLGGGELVCWSLGVVSVVG